MEATSNGAPDPVFPENTLARPQETADEEKRENETGACEKKFHLPCVEIPIFELKFETF